MPRTTTRRAAGRSIRVAAAVMVALAPCVAAQAPLPAPGPDLADLADAPKSTMSMKLEKTFLKIDVLTLTVRVDGPTAARLAALVESRAYGRDVEPDVAAIVLEAEEAIARIDFLRDVSLEQFLDGVDEDLGEALEAGWVDAATFEEVSSGLREWFGFLSGRGLRRGDRLTYHKVGDALRTTYRGVGETGLMLDQTDVGERFIMAFWGGYYAPGTSFRKDLVESLWDGTPGRKRVDTPAGSALGRPASLEEGSPLLLR